MYFYAAMADLAGELGDASLVEAMDHLWRHRCMRNRYITVGIGPSASNEYACAETCAAIGLVFWNHCLL